MCLVHRPEVNSRGRILIFGAKYKSLVSSREDLLNNMIFKAITAHSLTVLDLANSKSSFKTQFKLPLARTFLDAFLCAPKLP